MNRDPKEVGRLQVGAETLTEVLNKLFEPMTYKTMVTLNLSYFKLLIFFPFVRFLAQYGYLDPCSFGLQHHQFQVSRCLQNRMSDLILQVLVKVMLLPAAVRSIITTMTMCLV